VGTAAAGGESSGLGSGAEVAKPEGLEDAMVGVPGRIVEPGESWSNWQPEAARARRQSSIPSSCWGKGRGRLEIVSTGQPGITTIR
jgi:hypothetical protein